MGVRCTCPLSQLTHQRCVAPQLWDYESGGFERTLKGHTNAVQWVTFDKAGGFLGTRRASLIRYDVTTEACWLTHTRGPALHSVLLR